jgi:hypothetical protein
MSSTRKHSDRLLALAGAALALPGVAAQAADAGFRSDDIVLSYNHGEYSESDHRMDIHVDQLALSAPIGERFETRFEAIRDVTSGASPTYYTINIDGSPAMILQSGASIKDQRDVYRAGLGYYGDRNYYGVGIGRSREDDYEADFGSIDFRRTFNNKNTTLMVSAAYSSDVVWNTYDPNNILNEPSEKNDRRKHDLMVGISQVMDRNTVMQFNLTHSYAYGELSDPYKLATVADAGLVDIRGDFPYDDLIDFINYTDGTVLDNALAALGFYDNLVATGIDVAALRNMIRNNTLGELLGGTGLIDIGFVKEAILGALPDTRPDSRRQWIALWRYSHFIESNSSAIHVDYRYSYDKWDAHSHTIEAKWKKDFGHGWMIAPGLRYYNQRSAYFYDAYFQTRPGNGYYTSDYRLAGFGAWSAKFEISKAITEHLSLQFNYEYYKRKRSWEWLSNSVGYDVDDYDAQTYTVSLESVF